MRRGALVALAAALAWGPGALRAHEPMRTSAGAVLAWPDEATFSLCAGAGLEADARPQAAWRGALVWWSDGGLRRPVTLDPAPAACALADDGRLALVALTADAWPDGFGPSASTVAFTTHTFTLSPDGALGTLRDADVALNDGAFDFSPDGAQPGSFDLAVVVAHEVGHGLGLGHPCGDAGSAAPSCERLDDALLRALAEALMFPARSAGPQSLTLSPDDLAGLTARFPDAVGAPLATRACAAPDGWRLDPASAPGVARWALATPGEPLAWQTPDAPLVVDSARASLALIASADGALDTLSAPHVPPCDAGGDADLDATDRDTDPDDAASPDLADDAAPGASGCCAVTTPRRALPAAPWSAWAAGAAWLAALWRRRVGERAQSTYPVRVPWRGRARDGRDRASAGRDVTQEYER